MIVRLYRYVACMDASLCTANLGIMYTAYYIHG